MTQLYPQAKIAGYIRKFLAIFLVSAVTSQSIFAQPVINSFTPSSGPVGSSVTISGANFNIIAANNIVYFGAVRAVVTGATASAITVTVPIGASYQPITITTNNLTAYSAQPFVTSFAGSAYPFIPGSFAGSVNTATGSTPSYGAVGDIDGDGKPDFVVANVVSKTISILRNTGTAGTVGFSKTDITSTTYPSFVSLGDIDGDGKLDIVVTSNTNNFFLVYLNTSAPGTISFAAPISITVASPYRATNIVAEDIDGDGKTDIIATTSDGLVGIYLNTGTIGTVSFAPGVVYAIPGGSVESLAVADIDGDGKPDLIVSNSEYFVSVLRNMSTSGNISFSPRVDLAAGSAPFWVSVGDLDGDGMMDLAVVNANDNTVSVFRNQSTVGTISFAALVNFSTGTTPVSICMSDLNGDGKPDLAIANDGSNTVSVLQNTSSRGTISFAPAVSYGTSTYPYAVYSGDMDGDGVPDIITVNQYGNNTSVLRNLIMGPHISSFTPMSDRSGQTLTIYGTEFTGATGVSFGGTPASSFSVISDTSITAVVGAGASGSVGVTTAYGSTSLAGFVFTKLPLISSFLPANGGPGSVITIKGSNLTGTISVSFGGSSASSFTVESDTLIVATVGTVTAGDLNIAVANAFGVGTFSGFYTGPYITSFSPLSGIPGTTVQIQGNNFNSIPSNNIVYFGAVKATVVSATTKMLTVTAPFGTTYQPITVTTNNLTSYSAQPFTTTYAVGSSAFTDSSFVATLTPVTGSFPYRNFIEDVDGDGKPDIIVPNLVDNSFSVFRNTSADTTITMATRVNFGTGANPTSVSMGDLDGDGKPDVLVTNSSGGGSSISIFLNQSSGTTIAFAPEADFSTGLTSYSAPTSSAIADLDGDGIPDLAIANADNTLTVYRNISTPGAINLLGRQNFPIGGNATSISIRDFDGDGKPDIVTANSASNTLSVLLNTSSVGAISFAPAQNFTPQNGPYSLAIGDLDGDGKPDLAVCNANYTFDGVNYNYSVSVLRNTSTPGVLSFAAAVNLTAGNNPVSLTIADLDGDGKPDLAATSSSDSVSVFKNTSTNGTISFSARTDYPVGATPSSISAADLNADGKSELIISDQASNTLTILKNETGSSPAPVIRSFLPGSAGNGDSVMIIGNYFTGATSITFGGTNARLFNVISDTLIRAIVGRGNTGSVSVLTPQGVASLAGFIFVGSAISSFTPVSGTTGTQVSIYGTKLTGISSVSFGSVTAQSFTVVSDTLITAIVGTGGSGSVSMSGPNGSDSLAGFTFIITPPAPIITSFTPVSGTSGTLVTINGTNLTSITSVSFGSVTAQSFTVVSDILITATIGTGSSGSVVLSGPYGSDTLAGFTFINPPPPPTAPIITSFSPVSGASGTLVSIYGTKLTGIASVSFGSVTAQSFTVISDTLITAIVGTGNSGSVVLSGPNGSDTLAGFTFISKPPPPPPPPPTNFLLLNFSGSIVSNQSVLSWESENDESIGYYVIQSGTDSIQYTGISSIKGGKDSAISNYIFTDSIPQTGTVYYRLKMVDTTGNYSYSPIVVIRLGGTPSTLTLHPNPARNWVFAQIPNTSAQSNFRLSDMLGQIVRTIEVSPDVPSIKIDLTGLTQGIYKLVWSNGVSSAIQTLMIAK